ncbi:hypothetical protein [Tenacibaculum sp. UWU-22]|uniref:DUF7935 family protein n=1 Tax=Tenacibaculum sp. UWU-22 TaxID=3234187 RepID=UPI0034DB2FF5
MENKIIEALSYTLPAVVTGFVAYYFFSGFITYSNNEKKIALLTEKKKESLPLKLQAYERLLLFLERINPSKLVLRVKPINQDTTAYANLLIATIEQEFEHNSVQQLYISNACWKTILTAKNLVITKIKTMAKQTQNANLLQENLLIEQASQTESATNVAINFIKQEVKELL